MGWLFENFQILLVIGLALAAWLKNRGESQEEEEAERRAREEMIRGLEKAQQQTASPSKPPSWNTRPQSSTPPPPPSSTPPNIKPPPLRELFEEIVQRAEPPPLVMQAPQQEQDAYDDESAPWEAFKHTNSSDSEISDVSNSDDAILDRQRNMQERLAALKRRVEETKHEIGGARATQRRLEAHHDSSNLALPPLAAVLKDKGQTRRAIVLNEILGKPLSLR